MAVNIGPKIGIDGEAEYRKQINNIIQDTKTLKSEYEKVASSVDKSTASFKQNKEMHRVLSEEIKTQKDRIEQLSHMVDESAKAFGDADPKTQKWKQALNEATTELNKMESELKGLPSQVELLGDKFQTAGEKIKDIGGKIEGVGQALTPISTAAAGVLAGSAKSAIDFESAFTGVQKTVEATDEEFAELSDWIKEASTQMASSKTDIAGVMEIAGQLGISGVGNLEDFTKTMIMLGDTTNISADEAASSLAKFMNITGESTSDVDKIGSAIVDLGNNFATTEADIVEMSTRLASAGTIAGLSSTDILALSTSMSSVGINAEAGGTAMSQTLKKIATAVDKGGDSLKTYADIAGVSADEFSQTWKSSPIEAIEAFIGGLGRLNEEDESVIAVLDELGLTGIRQSNMIQALALSSDVLTDAVNTSNTAYGEANALQEEAEKRYGTTESKLLQAKESLTNVGIEIGERLLPYIDKGIGLLDQVIAAWDQLSPETQDMIVQAIGITAALAPVLVVGGKIISGIGSIVSGIGMLASPVGIAVLAIGALVAIGVALYKNWDEICAWANDLKERVVEAWNGIKQAASDVKDSINQKWNDIKQNTSERWNNIKDSVSSAMSSVKSKVEENGGGIKGVMKTAVEGYKNLWKGAFDYINEKTGGKLGEALSTVREKLDSIKDKFHSIFDNVKEKVRSAIDYIKGLFNFQWDLPDIRLPHFSISGKFSLDPPSVPHFNVDWYAKAMANGIRMTSPTIFGMNGNNLMAGGERGAEWVIGESSLLGMIRQAVNSATNPNNVNIGDTTIIINADGQDVEEIATRVDEIITSRMQSLEAVWGT